MCTRPFWDTRGRAFLPQGPGVRRVPLAHKCHRLFQASAPSSSAEMNEDMGMASKETPALQWQLFCMKVQNWASVQDPKAWPCSYSTHTSPLRDRPSPKAPA